MRLNRVFRMTIAVGGHGADDELEHHRQHA